MGEEWDVKETTMQDAEVREEGEGEVHQRCLWPMVRWQADPLKVLEINSGAESHQQPTKNPILGQGTAPEGDCDSEGSS